MDSDLPTSEAARTLSVHPDTLKRWARDGQIAYWKTPGKQFRFRRSDVEALRASRLADQQQAVAS